MITLGIALIIFLDFIIYLLIFDVILSWLTLLGLNFRPKFVSDILDPIYNKINRIIPTTIGPLKFDVLILFFLIRIIQHLLVIFIPGLNQALIKIYNILNIL